MARVAYYVDWGPHQRTRWRVGSPAIGCCSFHVGQDDRDRRRSDVTQEARSSPDVAACSPVCQRRANLGRRRVRRRRRHRQGGTQRHRHRGAPSPARAHIANAMTHTSTRARAAQTKIDSPVADIQWVGKDKKVRPPSPTTRSDVATEMHPPPQPLFSDRLRAVDQERCVSEQGRRQELGEAELEDGEVRLRG